MSRIPHDYWEGQTMAQKVQIVLEDDLDGGEATQTMTFGFGGVTYEIDLSDKNAAKLGKALAPFIEAGRKLGQSPATRGRKASGGPTAAEVREWALAMGMTCPHAVGSRRASARLTTRCTDREADRDRGGASK